MADIAISSKTAPRLSKDKCDKAIKYVEHIISKCNSLDELNTIAWKYCMQKLNTDISMNVPTVMDKKRVKTFATKLGEGYLKDIHSIINQTYLSDNAVAKCLKVKEKVKVIESVESTWLNQQEKLAERINRYKKPMVCTW